MQLGLATLAKAHDAIVRRKTKAGKGFLLHELDADVASSGERCGRCLRAVEGYVVVVDFDNDAALPVVHLDVPHAHVVFRRLVVGRRLVRLEAVVVLTAAVIIAHRGDGDKIIRARVGHNVQQLRRRAHPHHGRVDRPVVIGEWHARAGGDRRDRDR